MNEAQDLLNFKFRSSAFSSQGDKVITRAFSDLVQRRILQLEKISKEIGIRGHKELKGKGIGDAYRKFKNWIREEKPTITFDRRELRSLTYALNYGEDAGTAIYERPEELMLALDLLEENWRDSFLHGLFLTYLKNWELPGNGSFEVLAEFVLVKLEHYEGTRSRFTQLKSNLKYFRKNGALELGAFLYYKDIPLTEVTDFLGFPDHWISYPYFEGVINSYLERTKNQLDDYLDEITIVLSAHSNHVRGTRANKIILSKIICACEHESEWIQDKVKDIAFELVGDPGVSSNWLVPEDIGSRSRQRIELATQLLNEWITRQFISVFFERCIRDPRRKKFWLKYAKHIRRFKFFGPIEIKKVLKRDDRIRKYVEGRFHSVEGGSKVSAFMFLLGEHKMIEFSEKGYAFLAYKASNRSAPDFDLEHLGSVEEFRNGSSPMLVKREGRRLHSFNEEGRLPHHDGYLLWEEVFERWIKIESRIDV